MGGPQECLSDPCRFHELVLGTGERVGSKIERAQIVSVVIKQLITQYIISKYIIGKIRSAYQINLHRTNYEIHIFKRIYCDFDLNLYHWLVVDICRLHVHIMH